MSQQTERTPVIARQHYVTSLTEDMTVGLMIDTKGTATFTGEFVDTDSEGQRVFAGRLYTQPEYRRQGHATRLVSALAHLAVVAEIPLLSASIESQHTIAIFDKLFGDAVQYMAVEPITRTVIELPITTVQAMDSLRHAEAFEDDLENREIGFRVQVNLAGRRADEFERPDVTLA